MQTLSTTKGLFPAFVPIPEALTELDKFPTMSVKQGNAWSMRMDIERQRQLSLQQRVKHHQAATNASYPEPYYYEGQHYQPANSMPYPQSFYGQGPQMQASPGSPIWWNPSNPPIDLPELRQERARPLTTWSMIDNAVQEQEQPPAATQTPFFRSLSPNRQRFALGLTTPKQQTKSQIPHAAERSSGGQRRGRPNWRAFVRGRNNKSGHDQKVPVDIIRNNNLKDPALECNQPPKIRLSNASSDNLLMPRRTPPARYAALHNQNTAPMPGHLSTATARSNATAQSQYVQPIQNDALVMGNAPMIPTRDGNCK